MSEEKKATFDDEYDDDALKLDIEGTGLVKSLTSIGHLKGNHSNKERHICSSQSHEKERHKKFTTKQLEAFEHERDLYNDLVFN